ncbi:MAG TPA: hypothetical protein VNI57_04110, partial [Candidatus Saccharimonadales bacterium]|nr:hypothetical protein [Candidatus Saccharimonadales bacterium]
MAVTEAIPGKVLAAAGVQYDADAEDELAVVTAEGGLAIYDVTLVGPVPPNAACENTPVPQSPEPPAQAQLTLVASDPGFGSAGKVLSLCGVDYGLDGVEEIGSLEKVPGGAQALRIYGLPAAVGGAASLVADDPEYGGAGGRKRALAMSCTR